jgi:hypothetical protein
MHAVCLFPADMVHIWSAYTALAAGQNVARTLLLKVSPVWLVNWIKNNLISRIPQHASSGGLRALIGSAYPDAMGISYRSVVRSSAAKRLLAIQSEAVSPRIFYTMAATAAQTCLVWCMLREMKRERPVVGGKQMMIPCPTMTSVPMHGQQSVLMQQACRIGLHSEGTSAPHWLISSFSMQQPM